MSILLYSVNINLQESDDRVKLINHPTYPKRGRFTKDGMKFYMSDFGMNNPNLTLFGAPDNYPDGYDL